MAEPIELLRKDGHDCDIWGCGVCGQVRPGKSAAINCCRKWKCRECGDPTKKYVTECDRCRRLRLEKREQEILDAAEIVTETDDCMLLADDNWFRDMDEILDHYDDNPEEERPEFAFLSVKRSRGINAEHALEQMTEDMHEDAECDSAGAEEFREFVAAWNEKHAIEYFDPDYSRKIAIPKQEGGE